MFSTAKSINATAVEFKVGEPLWIALNVRNAPVNFNGINSYLAYDKNQISVNTQALNPVFEVLDFFGEDAEVDVVFENGQPGMLNIGIIPKDKNSQGKIGSGRLLRIKMTPNVDGIISLTWRSDSIAFDPNTVAIPVEFIGSSITIVKIEGGFAIFIIVEPA